MQNNRYPWRRCDIHGYLFDYSYLQKIVSLLENLCGNLRRHLTVTFRAGVQVSAGIICRQEVVGIFRVTQGSVKVDAAINQIGGADKFIVGVAHFLTEGRICPPATR